MRHNYQSGMGTLNLPEVQPPIAGNATYADAAGDENRFELLTQAKGTSSSSIAFLWRQRYRL